MFLGSKTPQSTSPSAPGESLRREPVQDAEAHASPVTEWVSRRPRPAEQIEWGPEGTCRIASVIENPESFCKMTNRSSLVTTSYHLDMKDSTTKARRLQEELAFGGLMPSVSALTCSITLPTCRDFRPRSVAVPLP
ncbi:hypothetical protein C8Q77DRAFT_662242 [Trametes polyzona]|nr:hypothetical protein C8Q77DRAFT_662242 [Trametes polyzona]